MKAFRVTFTLGEGIDKREFSLPAFEENTKAAKETVKQTIFILTQGVMPKNVKANAVIFGVDKQGTSLVKIKKSKK